MAGAGPARASKDGEQHLRAGCGQLALDVGGAVGALGDGEPAMLVAVRLLAQGPVRIQVIQMPTGQLGQLGRVEHAGRGDQVGFQASSYSAASSFGSLLTASMITFACAADSSPAASAAAVTAKIGSNTSPVKPAARGQLRRQRDLTPRHRRRGVPQLLQQRAVSR